MEMRKRLYHHFPQHEVEFIQKYNFQAGLPYLVKIFAGMNNKSGSFNLLGPKDQVFKAKRSIAVEIAQSNVDFVSLNNDKLNSVLEGIEYNGILDFRINIHYSYLDKNYNKVPTRGDTFLLRSDLEEGILTLKIHHSAGPGHTTCAEVASTLVEEIKQSN